MEYFTQMKQKEALQRIAAHLIENYGINSVQETYLEEKDNKDENNIVEEQQVSLSMTTRINPPEQRQTMKKKSAMEMLQNFIPQDPPFSDDEEEELVQLWLESGMCHPTRLWLGTRTW